MGFWSLLFISCNHVLVSWRWSTALKWDLSWFTLYADTGIICHSQTFFIRLLLTHLPQVPHMHQWIGSALIQIMACRLFGVKLLFKPMPRYIVNWTPGNKLQWTFNQNTKFFIHENASENIVCKMAALFVQGEMSLWITDMSTPLRLVGSTVTVESIIYIIEDIVPFHKNCQVWCLDFDTMCAL